MSNKAIIFTSKYKSSGWVSMIVTQQGTTYEGLLINTQGSLYPVTGLWKNLLASIEARINIGRWTTEWVSTEQAQDAMAEYLL